MSPVKPRTVEENNLSTILITLIAANKIGQTTCLIKVKTKAQVELLNRILIAAKFKRAKQINEFCWHTKNRAIVEEDAEYALYPYPRIDKFIFEDLRKLEKKQPTASLEKLLSKLSYFVWDSLKTYDCAFLDTPEQILLLKSIIKLLKSKQFNDTKLLEKILKDINYWMADWKTINLLGFNNLHSLINGLKEFIKYLTISSSSVSSL